jgi:hypothetical protein
MAQKEMLTKLLAGDHRGNRPLRNLSFITAMKVVLRFNKIVRIAFSCAKIGCNEKTYLRKINFRDIRGGGKPYYRLSEHTIIN